MNVGFPVVIYAGDLLLGHHRVAVPTGTTADNRDAATQAILAVWSGV